MRFPIFTLAVLAAVAAPARSQSGSFALFGNGCRSSGNSNCLDVNGSLSTPVNLPETPLEYAVEMTWPPREMTMFGFQLLTASLTGKPITINISYHRKSQTGGPTPLPFVRGRMEIGSDPGWYAGLFNVPDRLNSNQPFYVVFEGTNLMRAPYGKSGTTAIHFSRPINGSAWSGPTANRAWAVRVMCTPFGPAIPTMSHVDVPRLGRPVTVTLAQAARESPAMLVLGSNSITWGGVLLPWDMAPIGAAGCQLLVAMDVLIHRRTGGLGDASVVLSVPSSPALLGKRFYGQWFVRDAGANPLGVVVSPGAVGVVGR